MKKILTALTVFALIISFAACAKNPAPETGTTTAAEQLSEEITETAIDIDITEPVHTEQSVEASEAPSSTEAYIDPSEWTPDEIIEFYKKSAEKSHPNAKSNQVMVLNELIINNGDGALGFFIKILEPAIASVIEKNAFDFDGITGGFANLTASDTQKIRAYKNGSYTVIEMTMKNQTDGIHADAYAGSVGHAITVLGDISKVLAEFPQFEVDVENADIAVNYVNATVKVRINENGIIEKGTWKYTCDPEISHLDISGIMIDKADAEIDYIITVGGGF